MVDGELGDLWDGRDNARLASELLHLGFNVTKGPADRESARKNTIWSVNHLPLCINYLSELVGNRHICEGLGLVDLSSIVLDAVEFSLFVRSMILRELKDSHAMFTGHDGSRVTDISDVTLLFNGKHNDRAATGLVESAAHVSDLEELVLSLLTAVEECLLGIRWEAVLLNDNGVQMVFQEVSAQRTSMSVINGKKATFRPSFGIFIFRPSHIQNDGDTVLIIVSLYSLMCIGCVRSNQTMWLACKLRLLKLSERIKRLILH